MAKKPTIAVIGCSKLGAYVATQASLNGCFVTMVDKDKGSFVKLQEGYSGNLFEGDATELPTLLKAKVGECDEVNVFTSDDSVNIFIARLIGQTFPNVEKINVRLKYDNLSILLRGDKYYVISPFGLAMKEYQKKGMAL